MKTMLSLIFLVLFAATTTAHTTDLIMNQSPSLTKTQELHQAANKSFVANDDPSRNAFFQRYVEFTEILHMCNTLIATLPMEDLKAMSDGTRISPEIQAELGRAGSCIMLLQQKAIATYKESALLVLDAAAKYCGEDKPLTTCTKELEKAIGLMESVSSVTNANAFFDASKLSLLNNPAMKAYK